MSYIAGFFPPQQNNFKQPPGTRTCSEFADREIGIPQGRFKNSPAEVAVRRVELELCVGSYLSYFSMLQHLRAFLEKS